MNETRNNVFNIGSGVQHHTYEVCIGAATEGSLASGEWELVSG